MLKKHGLLPTLQGLLPVYSFSAFLALPILLTPSVTLAAPSVEQALALQPVQENIDFDQPSDKKSCQLVAAKNFSGWLLVDSNGQKLRRFLDTDGDKKLDQWCYYRDGHEVYRDMDTDKNGHADQYRWLGVAGTRWGIDHNEDGQIDAWKTISAEEASAEVLEALKTKTRHRFATLLVTPKELKTLGLSHEQQTQIAKMAARALENFAPQALHANIGEAATWINFSATRPGTIAAGNNGVTKDVVVYENTVIMYQSDEQHHQLALGTLIRVGDSWRLTQLPTATSHLESSPGLFFSAVHEANPPAAAPGQVETRTQEFLGELEDIDKTLVTTSAPEEIARLNENRADVLEKIIAGSTDKNLRESWIRQFADTVSAAVQIGNYPKGTERLEQLIKKLQSSNEDTVYVPYVQFRYLSANYTRRLQQPDADFEAIQEKWLDDLETYVNEYPQSQDTGEAMLQLALAQEFAGQEQQAMQWYTKIVHTSNDRLLVAKSKGAKRRLESVGKVLNFDGQTLQGQSLNLPSFLGKTVALHFWATWCEPCVDDMKDLKLLLAKYGSQGFTPIGVNLDSDQSSAMEFLRKNRFNWPHMHEPGGLDSRLANELGVLTLPTMLLIDSQGRVINRGLHPGDLQDELEKIFP